MKSIELAKVPSPVWREFTEASRFERYYLGSFKGMIHEKN